MELEILADSPLVETLGRHELQRRVVVRSRLPEATAVVDHAVPRVSVAQNGHRHARHLPACRGQAQHHPLAMVLDPQSGVAHELHAVGRGDLARALSAFRDGAEEPTGCIEGAHLDGLRVEHIDRAGPVRLHRAQVAEHEIRVALHRAEAQVCLDCRRYGVECQVAQAQRAIRQGVADNGDRPLGAIATRRGGNQKQRKQSADAHGGSVGSEGGRPGAGCRRFFGQSAGRIKRRVADRARRGLDGAGRTLHGAPKPAINNHC